jgi:hypothetical protein
MGSKLVGSRATRRKLNEESNPSLIYSPKSSFIVFYMATFWNLKIVARLAAGRLRNMAGIAVLTLSEDRQRKLITNVPPANERPKN